MALTDKLSAIGNAIRAKTGRTELLTLDAMPNEIASIETGGGTIPEEAFTLTGVCDHRFTNGAWDWFIKQYGDKITTVDISSAVSLFDNCKTLEEIPFDINFVRRTSASSSSIQLFQYCNALKTLPNLSGTIKNFYFFLNSCYNVREIPESWGTDINWDYINASKNWMEARLQGFFLFCYSLRTIPEALIKRMYSKSTSVNAGLIDAFRYCCCLDEIVGVRGLNSTLTSNQWRGTFERCFRLKRLVFDMDNGAPRAQEWKSQIIDLTYNVGFTSDTTAQQYILNYNSGITADKCVSDDTTYQALKDDPDWYTNNIAYSRYNHDSAVETINSLPDTSAYLATAGGTNTIRFKGDSGSSTDGGAINTMTEEEIAVAAVKGWTVAFV